MQQLTRGVRTKLGLFTLVGLVGTSYLGATYVGFSPFDRGYAVTVDLPDAGGLFVNSEVTYRGVNVGEVTDLTPTPEGVTVAVRIDGGAPQIPAELEVAVHNRSAIGEQYLDLTGGNGGDALADGDRLTGGKDSLPADLSQVLKVGSDFVASVPSDDLTTVVDETYDLTNGLSEDFSRLLTTSQDFARTADDNFLVSASLITNSERVLATQVDSGAAIRSFSKDLSLFATTLADSDKDLRTVLETTPGTARQISLLLSDVGGPLGTLMRNLVPTAEAFGENAAGVRDMVIRLPEAVSVGWAATGTNGLQFGLVPTFFNPLPCTQGYGGTDRHQGTYTGGVNPLNKSAGCTSPRSQTNVRGPQGVPGARSTGGSGGTAQRTTVADDLADLLGGVR